MLLCLLLGGSLTQYSFQRLFTGWGVQATLAMDAAPGQRVRIAARVADEQQVLLCLLRGSSLTQHDNLATHCWSGLVQATLAMDAAPGQRVGIAAKVADEQEVLLCSLREGGQESANLDIVLDHYTEFAVRGAAAVHLAGYYMQAYEQDEGALQRNYALLSHTQMFLVESALVI